ncbi:MAG TPA: hypothetical protein VFZ76_13100 [Anaerolineales bacterium]
MPGLDSHALITFVNRWVHVASMAVIFGGSFLMWAAARRYRSGEEYLSGSKGLLWLSTQYEWFFWGGLGLLALTGVGNIGNFGASLPGTNSAWGSRLLAKLIVGLVLALFSSVRTWVIAWLNRREEDLAISRTASLIQNLYAGTTLVIIAILVLAVSLSHG